MNKSVSATDLAKMLYCEASVTQKASFTKFDVLRMSKGSKEHKQFEQKLRTLGVADNIKETSLPNIKVSKTTESLTIPADLTIKQSNTKKRALIISTAIIVTAVVTSYLLTAR